jgi:hypothetical protein
MNESAIVKRVRMLLKQYARFRRFGFVVLSIEEMEGMDIPNEAVNKPISGIETSDKYIAMTDNREGLDVEHYKSVCYAVVDAWQQLDERSKIILYYTYLALDTLTGNEIAHKMVYSPRTIEILKRNGMIAFGCAYKHGSLLVEPD